MAVNFSMAAGDKKLVTITVLDADDAAVNITGATITWSAARNPEDEPLLTKTSGGGGISLTVPTDGIFVITIDEADTDDMIGNYYHEAEVELSSDITTVIRGLFYVAGTLIRAA